VIHLDTHALVWFLTGQTGELRPIAHKLRAPIGLSPVVFLEIQYLSESGKLALTGADARKDVAGLREFVVSPTPLLDVVERSLALEDGAVLLTRDRQILERCKAAAWG
jgi:hypothetical protein